MTKDGGSAFPVVDQHRAFDFRDSEYGLTKLEWFAGMVLQGLTSSSELNGIISTGKQAGVGGPKALAVMCFEFAEAMLAESERRSK